jgi:choline dehydrogenase-like flavoprotein
MSLQMRYLSHPFDLRLAISTLRVALALGRTEAYSKHILKPLHQPASDSEADLEAFARQNVNQAAHAMGSCRMGKEEDENSVVDARFRVKGVRGVRIADLSVCPVLTNNHTQINAYVIAQKCLEAVIGDLEIDSSPAS